MDRTSIQRMLRPAGALALVLSSSTGAALALLPTPSAAASTRTSAAVAYAESKLGDGYAWGGTGPRAFDCSGLVMEAWRHAGVTIPRTSGAQWARLPHVSLSRLEPGDIIVYYSGSHVALYVGGGKVVEANNPGQGVVREPVDYDGRPTGAVRPRGAGGGAPPSRPTPKRPAPHPGARTYTVRRGDTLSSIAAREHVPGGWRALYDANRSTVRSPGLIYPGEVLRLP